MQDPPLKKEKETKKEKEKETKKEKKRKKEDDSSRNCFEWIVGFFDD